MDQSVKLDPKDRNLLESIERQLGSSPFLNGGLTKLQATVENVQEQQQGMSDKVDAIHNSLYLPQNGLFAKMQAMEFDFKHMRDTSIERRKTDEKLLEDSMDKTVKFFKSALNE